MTFRQGQRVRVIEYPDYSTKGVWGNPHFIVGHFGHIHDFAPRCGLVNVAISRGPDGGPPDPRVFVEGFGERENIWPMYEHELEAVD